MAGVVIDPSAPVDEYFYSSPLPSPGGPAPEVDTEVEQEEEEARADDKESEASEVEEEVEPEVECAQAPAVCEERPSTGGSGSAIQRSRSTDYSVRSESREVWRAFGTNTEAGRVLRRLYKHGGASQAGSNVSYPSLPTPSEKWQPAPLPRKACPQRTVVRVPKPGEAKADPNDPKNWQMPVPCRRPAHEILAEMEACKPQRPNLPQGRNQLAEKQNLQDRFRFCGGQALPKGAMGNVPVGELPQAPRRTDRQEVDENGMNQEHREIFEELMQAVKDKQARIAEIDAENAKEGPSKAKTRRHREALLLRNEIDGCMRDVDKLLEITDASA